MKYFLFFMMLPAMSASVCSAQADVRSAAFVAAYTKAFNTKKSIELEPMLAPGFTFAGQQSPIATEVLAQLLDQLPGTINKITPVSDEALPGNLHIFRYSCDYTDLNNRPLAVTMTAGGKITELDVIGMEVSSLATDGFDFTAIPERIELRFIRAGNLILVPAFVNGATHNFLFDSGAPTLVLNNHYYESNRAAGTILAGMAEGASGAITNIDLCQVDSFSLGGLSFAGRSAVTMDLAHLERALKKEVYGLIGYEVFKDYDVLFDYAAGTITLLHQVKAASELSRLTGTTASAPFELTAHIPILTATIGGMPYRMGIDCGAEANLISDKKQPAVAPHMGRLRKDEIVGAGQGKIFSYTGFLNSMMIGGVNFTKVQTTFSDINNLNAAYHLNIDGLVGYEVLSRRRCLLSYKNKALYFL